MKLSRKARREILLILFFVCLFSYTYLLTFGDSGFVQLNQAREELHRLQIENLRLHELNRQKARDLERISSDPDEIERILREKLDYARPGDVIITLPDGQ